MNPQLTWTRSWCHYFCNRFDQVAFLLLKRCIHLLESNEREAPAARFKHLRLASHLKSVLEDLDKASKGKTAGIDRKLVEAVGATMRLLMSELIGLTNELPSFVGHRCITGVENRFAVSSRANFRGVEHKVTNICDFSPAEQQVMRPNQRVDEQSIRHCRRVQRRQGFLRGIPDETLLFYESGTCFSVAVAVHCLLLTVHERALMNSSPASRRLHK